MARGGGWPWPTQAPGPAPMGANGCGFTAAKWPFRGLPTGPGWKNAKVPCNGHALGSNASSGGRGPRHRTLWPGRRASAATGRLPSRTCSAALVEDEAMSLRSWLDSRPSRRASRFEIWPAEELSSAAARRNPLRSIFLAAASTLCARRGHLGVKGWDCPGGAGTVSDRHPSSPQGTTWSHAEFEERDLCSRRLCVRVRALIGPGLGVCHVVT